MDSSRFWVNSLGYSTYRIMLSENKDNFTLSFSKYMPIILYML